MTFKREFPFKDALTMFEIISSQHLELSSMEAERERERQRVKEQERDGNRFVTTVLYLHLQNKQFTVSKKFNHAAASTHDTFLNM